MNVSTTASTGSIQLFDMDITDAHRSDTLFLMQFFLQLKNILWPTERSGIQTVKKLADSSAPSVA